MLWSFPATGANPYRASPFEPRPEAGTLRSIIKQAGLSLEEFKALL
jgi:hypothetical protein